MCYRLVCGVVGQFPDLTYAFAEGWFVMPELNPSSQTVIGELAAALRVVRKISRIYCRKGRKDGLERLTRSARGNLAREEEPLIHSSVR